MATLASDHVASQLRAALLLSAIPVVLGVILILSGEIGEGGPLGFAGPLVALIVAWLAFMATALVPALAMSAVAGPRFALRTRTPCPACQASVPIISYRCTQCRYRFGLPESSRSTYVMTMLAWGVFMLVLHLRPDGWLAS